MSFHMYLQLLKHDLKSLFLKEDVKKNQVFVPHPVKLMQFHTAY